LRLSPTVATWPASWLPPRNRNNLAHTSAHSEAT
jgi:hypothetical protein